ncbi:MAG TPA: DUF1566 domain-containing protein [Polyangiaceae bacterium]|nr:DUF1566 domain-containing protein [Polyangiaceae bacterium]
MKLQATLAKIWLPALALVGGALVFASVGHADAPAGRFTISNGSVSDNQTGLVWQQSDDGNTYAFAAAQTHCSSLGAGWRAPSMKELQTIVDETRVYPAIDNNVFPTVSSVTTSGSCYQTSTVLAGSNISWIVCFDSGRPTYDNENDTYHVLCVH